MSTKHKLDTIVATAGQGMLQQLEMGEGELKEMAAVVMESDDPVENGPSPRGLVGGFSGGQGQPTGVIWEPITSWLQSIRLHHI